MSGVEDPVNLQNQENARQQNQNMGEFKQKAFLMQQEQNKKRYEEEIAYKSQRFMAKINDWVNRQYRVENSEGKLVNVWDVAYQKGTQATKGEGQSYNDWKAAMMSLCDMLGSLAQAMSASGGYVFSSIFLKIPNELLTKLRNDKAESWCDEPAFSLFRHCVNVNEDGTLNIQLFKEEDKIDPDHTINNFFKIGVDMWLKERGYTWNENLKGYYHNVDGRLTDALFSEEGSNSFESFLLREIPQDTKEKYRVVFEKMVPEDLETDEDLEHSATPSRMRK